MEPSNEELIQACRRGDGAAWEALITRYQRLVYSIPRRAGLDEDRSAEVFQQVFAKLVEHLDRIEEPDRLGSWLATTARREMWRLRQRERITQPSYERNDPGDDIDDVLDDAPLLDEMLIRLEQQHAIHLAVASLDERCRRLLTLLFYQSKTPSYAEIAVALGMSEGSVGPIRMRCLQKLRRLLKNRVT
jgi:RNA polymerase sigma factor (sigma-70 family)